MSYVPITDSAGNPVTADELAAGLGCSLQAATGLLSAPFNFPIAQAVAGAGVTSGAVNIPTFPDNIDGSPNLARAYGGRDQNEGVSVSFGVGRVTRGASVS